jgi:hypothetical protein
MAFSVVADTTRGTGDFDPEEQHLHSRHVAKLVTDMRSDPLWCFGYWGHGVNSYAYSFTCRLGPLALAVQGLWVPWVLYDGPSADAAELAAMFQIARALFGVAGERPGPVRVLVDASQFRAGYFVPSIPPSEFNGAGVSGIFSPTDAQLGTLGRVREQATQLVTNQNSEVA